jgi:methylmalonyl-CoA mutase
LLAETIVGVNKYRLEKEEEIEVLSIDNSKVITSQKAKLQQVRSSRNTAEVKRALSVLTAAAENKDGNLLELSMQASRVRCTVGEISDALEGVFGRHVASTRMVSGAYAKAYGTGPEMEEAIQKCKVPHTSGGASHEWGCLT